MWLAVSVPYLGIGLTCIALAFVRSGQGDMPPAPSAAGGEVAKAPAEKAPVHVRRVAQRTPVFDREAARPLRIVIPSISVSAPVIPLGLNADRTLEVPDGWDDAGWYVDGPEPGERGPAVVAGHVDSTSGPAVFYRIGELHPGQRISVERADGSSVGFRVRAVERWPKDRFPTRRVYHPTRGSALRLITCGGSFDESTGHYLDNTIVYAARMSRRGS
jgi:sortase (surface protein transpeptidase)